ncbi:MAG TPA: YicC/YloC family endoribonuclease [Candidatus Acidoferrales bacterium]|nr:YicC/YloC family endoribonuclease [Candidatus Acidoferrales bacterium]
MKSMTGYGEAAHLVRGTKITVQIRSLNHRHLDLQLRVPREYLAFEEEIRKTLREKILRGRIDLFINRFPGKGQGHRLEVDEALLGQYLQAIKKAKKKYRLSGDVDVSLFARLPDLFHVKEVEVDKATERQGVFGALAAALEKLQQSREREGKRLKADMQSQLNHLRRIAGALQSSAAEIGLRLQKPAVSADENRNSRPESDASNAANWLLKGDINEEVVRLKGHVIALSHALREREPVGKKIDFLLQEVQRELNTISSKMPQLAVVQLVLEGKERVEKIREQTQNIE